jgi:hypothetical protein
MGSIIDVYWGKKEQILKRRETIKRQNMQLRWAFNLTEKLNATLKN